MVRSFRARLIAALAIAVVLASGCEPPEVDDDPVSVRAESQQIELVSDVGPAPAPDPAAAAAYLQRVWETEQAVAAYLHNLWLASLPKVPALLHAIAMCESVNGQYIYRDHGHSTSTASGKFGFLDSTWRSWRAPEGTQYARAYQAPEWVQDAAAMRLFAASGTRPWVASRGCWSRR